MQEEVIQEALRRLEESEGGGVFFGGRVITDPAELESEMRSASPDPLQAQPATLLPVGSDQKETQYENAIASLSPGSALFVPTGDEPTTGDSLFGYWVAPGDFRLFLQPGESGTRSDGLVRELLVGAYRTPEDSDFEFDQGTFIPDSEWDAVVGAVHRECLQLRELIGEIPEGAHPDEIKPRAASFMAERANWETEVAALRTSESDLRATVASLTARNAELLSSNAELLTASVAAGLPGNALELIQTAGGLSKPKAESVLAALTAPTD